MQLQLADFNWGATRGLGLPWAYDGMLLVAGSKQACQAGSTI